MNTFSVILSKLASNALSKPGSNAVSKPASNALKYAKESVSREDYVMAQSSMADVSSSLRIY